MSHELEVVNGNASMFWLQADGAPWHGLGKMITGKVQSGAEAIKLAGLDWTVSTRPLYFWTENKDLEVDTAEDGSPIYAKTQLKAGSFAVVRDTDSACPH